MWLDNYVETLQNKYFLLALKNSLLIILIAVPILIVLALIISLALSYGIKWVRKTRFAFVLPIYLLFIWKNIGICIVLLTAAFTSIERSVFEAARLDGANSFGHYSRRKSTKARCRR